jgi:alpha-galactosidase
VISVSGRHNPDRFFEQLGATGFDFDFNRIASLYEPAKQLGVELFLLDDGWFGNKYPRVNDRAGLGDWEPNRKRLPNGLAPLAKEAVKNGLTFGIWIEPEMVNPRSELFEKHPNWVIRQPKRELELQRNQLTLDLTRPEVQKFEWSVIQKTLSVPDVSYAKWDCNRYLTQAGSQWLPADRQSHLWVDYVRALYALMDRTAKTFPEIELSPFRRRRASGLRGAEVFPRVLAQRQYRPGAPGDDAVGLLLFLSGHDPRQPRDALGQPAAALRVCSGDERKIRNGSRPRQIVARGQGHLCGSHQRVQTDSGSESPGRVVSTGATA